MQNFLVIGGLKAQCFSRIYLLNQKNKEIIRNELRDLWFETKWKNEEILYRNIRLLLEPKNITPIKWHKNQKLKRQHLDIYFPKYNIGIEYQGEQHSRPIEFFGGEEGFKATKERDKRLH